MSLTADNVEVPCEKYFDVVDHVSYHESRYRKISGCLQVIIVAFHSVFDNNGSDLIPPYYYSNT